MMDERDRDRVVILYHTLVEFLFLEELYSFELNFSSGSFIKGRIDIDPTLVLLDH